ncbi:ATP-binding protein [candidate division WWE3 bacterium]|nr:ATP-binding protein [candidate division WWE3 bacterium]
MPQYFNNTGDSRPMSVDESRERLKGLLNRDGQPTNTPVPEEGVKVRSRIMSQLQEAARPINQTESPQEKSFVPLAQVHSEDSLSNGYEQMDAQPAAYNEVPVSPVESPEILNPTPSSTPAVIAPQPQATEHAQVAAATAKLEQAYSEEPVDNGPALSTEVDYKTLNPQNGNYWNTLWNKFVKSGTVFHQSEEKVVLEVSVPQDNEVEIPAAEQLYSSLTSVGQKQGFWFDMVVGILPQFEIFFKNPEHSISWEIAANNDSIRFWVVVPKSIAEYIERQIHGSYPDADISIAKTDDFFLERGHVQVSEVAIKGRSFYPIRDAEDLGVDPLSSITSAVSKLSEHERVLLQIMIQPADDGWRNKGQAFINGAQNPPKDDKVRRKNVDPQLIQAVQEKLSRPGFRVAIRILVQASDPQQTKMLTDNIIRTFDQFDMPQMSNLMKTHVKMNHQVAEAIVVRRFPEWGNYPVLNTKELAALYHFPNKNIHTPRLSWLRFRKSPPPTNVPTEGLYLGKSEFRGTDLKVHLGREDRRRHLYIIGQTGTGKSEFLKYLAYQDIMNGDGLAFIDPHGEAVEDILQMIPKERAEDVIYFNPADTERPFGLNILDAKTEDAQHLVVNSFIGLLYKLYDPNHSGIIGPQLERAVRNVMLTAMAEPGNSMIEVLKLLVNDKFAESKIPLIKDPLVKSFWTDQMANTSQQTKSETLGYFVSKFDRFVTEKMMRNVIGQSTSSFDFREVMDKRKILLVNLSKGLIGEDNSNFLGLIIVPRILAAAMSRADMANQDRKDFFLYVDEFQNFATPDFAQILAEARKYRLNLVVANQFIAQMKEEIRDAVFGNVGTMVSFRVGVDDGGYLEKQFDPVFKQSDLINLTMGQCVVRLLIGGQQSRPFSFKTDWPAMQEVKKNSRIAEVIKEISRLKYGRDRSIVENEIAVRAGF